MLVVFRIHASGATTMALSFGNRQQDEGEKDSISKSGNGKEVFIQ